MVVNQSSARMDNLTAEQGSSNKERVDGNNNDNNDPNNNDAASGTDNNNNNNEDSNSCQSVSNSNTITVSANVKYQLRPRSLQARRFCDSDWSIQDTIIRHKPRPPPLSRYRRKTANARERHRMRQINTAFESLRGVLPSWVCSRRAASDLTKITTLRLASAYIRALQDILEGNADEETYPWVLANILDGSTSKKENPKLESPPEATIKTQLSPPYTPQEGDLVSLLCSSSSATVLEENLEFPYLSSMSEGDDMSFFLGCDSPRSWQTQQQHTPLVT
ncbi:helix-loop-helix protein delilah-like [Macrobrachium rosenbergii]|uniref:helix-loop-helix protein delilah-like n=1 Tax=Macrobrachium rosenbergii TaxID=79674 RepID=UPI0034D55462